MPGLHLKLNPTIATSEAGFVFDPTTGDSYAANPLAAEVLRLLQAGHDLPAVQAHLLARYDVPLPQVERDLADFVAQLAGFGLLESGELVN